MHRLGKKKLHVPARTKITLSTINEGDIEMEGVSRGFYLRNVNDGVELDAVSAAGDAETVNGEVKAASASNPGADCSFSTANRSGHMYFRPARSAFPLYKAWSGDVYTDFPATPVCQTRDGVTAFRWGGFSGGRVGSGGPEIQVDALNGSIFVHRAW